MCLSHTLKYTVADRMVSAPVTQDAHGHERLKPEPEAKLRQDETGKHELGKGIGLAHEERIDGDRARQHPR